MNALFVIALLLVIPITFDWLPKCTYIGRHRPVEGMLSLYQIRVKLGYEQEEKSSDWFSDLLGDADRAEGNNAQAGRRA